DDILAVQKQWAHANYQLEEDEQEKAFELLVTKVQGLIKTYPDKADSWVWSGIVKSSFGGAKGGLGALSLVKAAKKDLEKAIEIDGTVLQGSAYASLGVLYHKVPGWPIGFGSDEKALKLLKKALEINPEGKESNFFYGEYLYDDSEYRDSLKYLLVAQAAPAKENRPVAYEFRQKEIAAMIENVQKKLDKIAKRKGNR
ncbi:MAG: tetratricopeptide (TPR) repeat protein, partial [Alteromonadaceae bacterium]